jgi:urease accessory protein UreF
MLDRRPQTIPAPPKLAGEALGLAERLGTTAGLSEVLSVSATTRLERVHDLASLGRFVADYHQRVLLPVELPAVYQAFLHASRHETRELVALDQRLRGQLPFKDLAEASRRVGWNQLRKLRPLRDERLVRRYIESVEQEQAYAWHTVVYGVMLAIYALPLRQGLVSYAWHTTHGFVQSAARSLWLNEVDAQRLLNEVTASLPTAVKNLLAQEPSARMLSR